MSERSMEEEQQGLVRWCHGRVLHEVLQRAWQDQYGPRGQGPLTAPEMKKIRTTLQTPSQGLVNEIAREDPYIIRRDR